MPTVVVLAGPNGAGKTTASRSLLAETLGVLTFVNADVIARGLSGFNPETASVEAGRIMLDRLRQLAEARADFAFETTLSGRYQAAWLGELKQSGCEVRLFYFWLASADLAVQRVAVRVANGGHDIPEPTIRRRYGRSIANFFGLYRPMISSWRLYDNSKSELPLLIAEGDTPGTETVYDQVLWQAVRGGARS